MDESRLDWEMSQLVKSSDFGSWRQKVEATGGCMAPVWLRGRHQITHVSSNRVLRERAGVVAVPCGTRRAGLCPPCASRYAADAFHLLRAGLTGDDTKGISKDVSQAPRVFATLTAPSFGRVHSRGITSTGKVKPCGCGRRHSETDTRLGHAIDPDSYDYIGAVLWQAHVGDLWQRFRIALTRRLAAIGGIKVRDLKDHMKLSYSKVAEFQKRGLVHFHAVIRVDGPTGPESSAPQWVTTDLLDEIVHHAAAQVVLEVVQPGGSMRQLTWGTVDVRPISTNDNDDNSDTRLAGYIAKYATKDSGASQSGVDKRFQSREAIEHWHGSAHHQAMMLTAWDLGELPEYAHLNLQRVAHMLGFRGHFLTKSKQYSTTFKAIRAARQLHRMEQLLAELDVADDEITVINDWHLDSVGHKSDAERELAHVIGERLTRHNTKE